MRPPKEEVRIRAIGNSLGVIIPRDRLRAWGLAEGDVMQVTEHGLAPGEPTNAHQRLDEVKLRIAAAVVAEFPLERVRRKSLENLARWKD